MADDIEVKMRVRCEVGVDWEIARGRKAFERGDPIPPMPSEEDAKELTVAFCYWIGYMLARGKKLMEQWRVEAYLNNPDPNEPRPRKAA